MRFLVVVSLFILSCVFSESKKDQKVIIPFPEEGATFRWINLQSTNGSIKKEYGNYWNKIKVQREENGIYKIINQETFGDSQFSSRSIHLNTATGKVEDDSINGFHPLMRINEFPDGYLSDPIDGEITLQDYIPNSDKIEVGYGKYFNLNGFTHDSVIIMVLPPKTAPDENGFVYIFDSNHRKLLQEYTVSPSRTVVQGWEVQF